MLWYRHLLVLIYMPRVTIDDLHHKHPCVACYHIPSIITLDLIASTTFHLKNVISVLPLAYFCWKPYTCLHSEWYLRLTSPQKTHDILAMSLFWLKSWTLSLHIHECQLMIFNWWRWRKANTVNIFIWICPEHIHGLLLGRQVDRSSHSCCLSKTLCPVV